MSADREPNRLVSDSDRQVLAARGSAKRCPSTTPEVLGSQHRQIHVRSAQRRPRVARDVTGLYKCAIKGHDGKTECEKNLQAVTRRSSRPTPFGGVREILKGRTPEAHEVFTDDLTRARHQLASSFEAKSSGMAPVSVGSDISGFGRSRSSGRGMALPKSYSASFLSGEQARL